MSGSDGNRSIVQKRNPITATLSPGEIYIHHPQLDLRVNCSYVSLRRVQYAALDRLHCTVHTIPSASEIDDHVVKITTTDDFLNQCSNLGTTPPFSRDQH